MNRDDMPIDDDFVETSPMYWSTKENDGNLSRKDNTADLERDKFADEINIEHIFECY